MSNAYDCPDLSCYDNIIGLSETTCECYPDNDYMDSLSCLFLDQAEGMNLRMINSLTDCATEENIWLLMDRARTKAVKRFVAETNAMLAEHYTPQRTFFRGYVGRNYHKNLRTLSKTYAGMRMRAGQITGGYVKITAINTIFQATGTMTLDVYNSLNDHLYSVTLNTTAGVVTRNVLSTPMVLPLWDGRAWDDGLDYVFVYTYNAANKPYDNLLSCCGHSYDFNCESPYYRQKSNKLEGWANWFMAGNIETDSLDFSDLDTTTGDWTDGLQLEVQTYCESTRQFCFDEPNVHDDQFMSVAYAILHAAAQYLAIDLITSDKINRYTMLNIEQMEAVRQLHETKYTELKKWLVEHTDLRNTDCYYCKEKFAFRHGLL